ncbi:MAG TPA: nuclear transport factor 2 family protein [Candidatus Binatia bacterium]|jgi:hypothetical protein|nr:nuclear transport factor 2 family protein [Candidatus Binatia bacterium]
MALHNREQTEKTLLRHWQAFGDGDVEAIMADYAEDAVLITPDGVLKGSAQIRSLFAQIFANMFPPDETELNLTKQVVEGKIAYILWSGSSPNYNAPFATDTFVMRDGKIVAQNICGPAGSEINKLSTKADTAELKVQTEETLSLCEDILCQARTSYSLIT